MKKNKPTQEQLALFSSQSPETAETQLRTEKASHPTVSKPHQWTVFIDGAARGNPGKAGAGIYGLNHEGAIIVQEGLFLGEKTNNQAEYLALVLAIYFVKNHLESTPQHNVKITFVSDSELLIRQMSGIYKVKNPILKQMKTIIDTLLLSMKYSFKHVLREYNVQADALANLGVDKKRKLPKEIIQFAALYNVPL
jgi:ribonuclease HI